MAKKKKQTEPRPRNARVKTIAAAAARLGVGERTLAAWLSRGAPGRAGQYDVDAIATWRAANLKPRTGRDDPKRAKWEARKARAEARTKELAYRRLRGDVIDIATATRLIRQHIAEVVTHLDQLPDFAVAGHRLDPATKGKMRERLRGKVRDMRQTLERSLRAMAKESRRASTEAAPDELAE